ncbi:carbon-nitrogen hydrolase family protein [Desulfurispora thermophila]|uniref:carbon-nitrogen hydrolase family protein n=1 Tax=Desulfurispora thermophila TaxID=265470 RepID=UPI00035FABEC|nr:carbon-nitrogen hydrolase family protein [Desulfurispora thermophila]
MSKRELVTVGICQLDVLEDKQANIEKAVKMIDRAADAGAELVVLPEMFNCPYHTAKFKAYAESWPEGETLRALATAARDSGVYLVGGSIAEQDGDNLYNTSFIFAPDGKLLSRHRKVHLFDVDLPGGISVKESATLGYGNQVTVVPASFGSFGVAICYDIRFPELARLMVLRGAQIIVVPAAFNMTTGPAHWHLLYRMRAVDNQVFMVAASPARNVDASYVAYGHSLVVDPWGEIVAEAGTGEQLLIARMDLDRLRKVRAQLPLLRHRRTDIYTLQETGGPVAPVVFRQRHPDVYSGKE